MWAPNEIDRVVKRLWDTRGTLYEIGGDPDGSGPAPYVVRGKPALDDPKPTSFDCSGFSRWGIAQGRDTEGRRIILPHGTRDQVKVCEGLVRPPLPLDMGFADLDGSGAVDHVVIYVGGGNVLEARGKPYWKVIQRPAQAWERQKGFWGWFTVPGIYIPRRD